MKKRLDQTPEKWPQLYDYARSPETPEEIGNLARTLASMELYREADEVLLMHETYERSMNYYRLIASTAIKNFD